MTRLCWAQVQCGNTNGPKETQDLAFGILICFGPFLTQICKSFFFVKTDSGKQLTTLLVMGRRMPIRQNIVRGRRDQIRLRWAAVHLLVNYPNTFLVEINFAAGPSVTLTRCADEARKLNQIALQPPRNATYFALANLTRRKINFQR